tara:strand:- start:20944 stop:21354 length:411 start_codon:yes stop_codon:yes gene_type:complete
MELTIRDKVRKLLMEQEKPHLHFNEDGRFNKDGQNIVYMGDNPIVTFGVGEVGNIEVDGRNYPNSIMLRGGWNASEQKQGYSRLAIAFIFEKLPRIENLILECRNGVYPVWVKLGGEQISVRDSGGHPLRTLKIAR